MHLFFPFLFLITFRLYLTLLILSSLFCSNLLLILGLSPSAFIDTTLNEQMFLFFSSFFYSKGKSRPDLNRNRSHAVRWSYKGMQQGWTDKREINIRRAVFIFLYIYIYSRGRSRANISRKQKPRRGLFIYIGMQRWADKRGQYQGSSFLFFFFLYI